MHSLDVLQERLGITFNNVALLEQAVTHKSYLKELQDQGLASGRQDQQRLEFLGDSFLSYAVGREMFEAHPDAEEGRLTELRRDRVRGTWLHVVGEELRLKDFLRLGRGEAQHLLNKKHMEDTMEAVVGAVLLDQGEAVARELIRRLILEPYSEETAPGEERVSMAPGQATTLFMQRWQALYRNSVKPPEPEYVRIGGPDHLPMWMGSLTLPSGDCLMTEGTSKKEIKDELYRQALLYLS